MALKLIIDNLEDVEEAFRGMYTAKDGKFHLDVEGIEDNTAIKDALRKANKEALDRRKQLEGWHKLGKTAEEIEALLAKETERETTEAERKGEWEKLKAQMNEKHQADLKKKDLVIEEKDKLAASLRSSLERHLVDANATAAIASLKGVPELLLPHVRQHIKVVEDENGQFQVTVVDAKGGPRVNGKGEPLSISEFVGEMQQSDIYSRAFEGVGSSGSGTRPPAGGGGPTKRKSEFKSEKERAEWMATFPDPNQGIAAYKALAD